MKHSSFGFMTALLLSVSSVSVFAEDTPEPTIVNQGETVRHPFQLLTLSGNVIGLPRRDSIPVTQYDLRYSIDSELCADFRRITSNGLDKLVISTQGLDLSGGYSTISWTPEPDRTSAAGAIESTEVLLHDATWYSEIEGMRLQYRSSMMSQVGMGKFNSCNTVENKCDIASYTSMEWSEISEFAGTERWGTLAERGSARLLGLPTMYDADGVPDYESHMPGYWLYQFLNVITMDGKNYIVYFRPDNLWVNTNIPDHKGVLVWDISDHSINEFASCWLEEVSDDH